MCVTLTTILTFGTKNMLKNKNPIQQLIEQQRAKSPIKDMNIKSQSTTINNLETYGSGTYIIRSPGNDLLDFYDKEMQMLDPRGKAFSKIPPSVVYHYRFDHEYPPELFDKSKNYGRNAYLRDQLKEMHQTKDPKDKTYWGQVYTTRFRWLVDKPHQTYEFKYLREVEDFLKNKFNQTVNFKISANRAKWNSKREASFTHMNWRGALAGWSITWHD